MNLTFERNNLLYALQVLQGVASARTTLPILSNMLIRAKDGMLECAATDLEIGIIIKVEAVIHQEGAITIPAQKLGDIVKELPDKEPINISLIGDNRIELKCGRGTYKITGLPEDEFPDIPNVESDVISVKGETLINALFKTEYAASTDEVRYFLNGLYFNFLEDRTEVVATDGNRLSLTHFEPLLTSEDSSDKSNNFIIPLKAIKQIIRAFGESKEIRMSVVDNQIVFADDMISLTSRLIEGEYPPYERLLTDEKDNRIIISKNKVLSATRRVSLLSNPSNYLISLDIGQEQLQVFTRTPDLGEAHEDINIEAVEDGGAEEKIGFDARLLEEAVSHIESDSLAMEFSDSLKPVLIKPVGPGNHISLVMPMRSEEKKSETKPESQTE